tara:strand:- start:1031 stop:1168 length:138 start_codon:yes stop_codon:yes gene_type:complete
LTTFELEILAYLAIAISMLIIFLSDDSEDDDDQGGGMMQPVYNIE